MATLIERVEQTAATELVDIWTWRALPHLLEVARKAQALTALYNEPAGVSAQEWTAAHQAVRAALEPLLREEGS